MAAEAPAQDDSPAVSGPSSRLWLLRLVPDIRYGRWLVSALIFLGLVGAFAACGMFSPDTDARHASPSVMLFFCVNLAYIVPIYHYISERSVQACRSLEPSLPVGTGRTAEHRVDHKPRRWIGVVTFLAIATGTAHNWTLWPAETNAAALFANTPAQGVSILATSLVWFVMTFAVAGLIDNAYLFRRLAKEVTIDLLNTRDLNPFGSVSVSSTLAIIGAQAAFSVMFIGGPIDLLAVVPGLVATGIPLVLLFFVPIWPIHRRLAKAKDAELDRLSRRIARAPRPVTNALDALTSLNPLLDYRREITEVSEWPFSTGNLGRLAIYLVIVPLTWVGAALIEMGLDAAL